MAAPPGMTDAAFAAALAEFAAVVGAENVYTSDEDIALYRDAYSPFWDQPEERLASAAVAPASTEEVQGVMRVAHARGVPIYPISTGKNLGYGGSAPAYSGSVVLDLKRMDRVLAIDEANASVLVEPGVSYFDLFRVLEERGLQLCMDCPDPGWGSLLGNALDRGGGFTMAHLRNHFDAHCGMEVVLPDGELLRTGMGALPAAETWQQYKSGYGPWVDGLFSQSNFGVVTKMGFWLMPMPEAYLRTKVTAPRYDDIHRFIEILTYAENTRLVTGLLDLAAPLLGTAHTAERDTLREYGPAPMSDAHRALIGGADVGYSPELEAYGFANGIPYWSAALSFYGPPEVVEAQWGAVKRLFSEIDGVGFEDGETVALPVPEERRTEFFMSELGIPSLRRFSVGGRSPFNADPTHGHLWFSPIIPRTGAALIEANRVFRDASAAAGLPPFPPFAVPALVWERAFIFIYGVPITRDPETDRRYVEGLKSLIRVAGEHGWGEYRTAPALQDAVMAEYSFNDHALRRFHERIKDTLDPNGVLAAGRYGVWPAHLRGDRP